mmetsp:Transcript_25806/g.29960  ORF Transcript_25806/g.29960 Transcript_25806/m.29960 type:complete len:533 (+) Transcript_25806:165-1763(+)
METYNRKHTDTNHARISLSTVFIYIIQRIIYSTFIINQVNGFQSSFNFYNTHHQHQQLVSVGASTFTSTFTSRSNNNCYRCSYHKKKHYILDSLQILSYYDQERIKHSKSRKYTKTILHSSIFFDDDSDINWDDDDDDDDDDINFDVKHQGRTVDNEENSNSIATLNDQDDDFEDDTDESYYDNLFKQQSNLISTKDENEKEKILSPLSSMSDDYEDEHEHAHENETENNNQKYSEEINNTIEEHEKESMYTPQQKAEIQYQQMKQLEKEFRMTQIAIQTKHVQKRKQSREQRRKLLLEERAMLLALRALRQQSLYTTEIHQNIENDLVSMSSVSVSASAVPHQPSPTLSLSSKRNYKRRDDFVDNLELKLEQRLYGSRFKVAFNLYLRLLETIDEIQNEGKARATDYITDKVAMSAQKAVLGENRESDYDTERMGEVSTVEMGRFQQDRMSTIIALSLYGGFGSKRKQNTFCEENIYQSLNEIFDVDLISTKDLVSILRIRGKYKRRGKVPQTRAKVLEHLTMSLTTDLVT